MVGLQMDRWATAYKTQGQPQQRGINQTIRNPRVLVATTGASCSAGRRELLKSRSTCWTLATATQAREPEHLDLGVGSCYAGEGSAMGMFFQTTTQLRFMNTAVFAMFVFGQGLAPLPQTTPGAPSTCDAPFAFYERVALLHHLFLAAVLVSCALGSHARRTVAAVAGEGGGGLLAMDAGSRLRIRTVMLVAVVLSALAAGLALGVYTYILQIKYVVFACMPLGVRVLVFSVDVVAAVACTCTYGGMARAVLFAE